MLQSTDKQSTDMHMLTQQLENTVYDHKYCVNRITIVLFFQYIAVHPPYIFWVVLWNVIGLFTVGELNSEPLGFKEWIPWKWNYDLYLHMDNPLLHCATVSISSGLLFRHNMKVEHE